MLCRDFKIENLGLSLLSILLAIPILTWLAIYNGFPIYFNNDTGLYIENAINRFVAADRPVFYGLFIYLSSFNYTLWTVVVFQSFIVSLILFLLLKYCLKKVHVLQYLLTVVFVSFFTTVSFETSWLMPDVFAAIMIICISLFLVAGSISKFDMIVLLIILFWSIAVHNSHFFIGLSSLLLLLSVRLMKKTRKYLNDLGVSLKRIILLISFFLLCYLGVGLGHYLYNGNFQSSRGGTVFLFSNMIEMGITNLYLDEYCADKKYAICTYKDSLPNNFLWDEKSPIRKGGWEKNSIEYDRVVKDILQKPKYITLFIYRTFIYSGKQFFNFDMVDIARSGERIDNAVRAYYPYDYKGLKESKENKDQLHLGFLNFIQIFTFMVFSILYFFYFSIRGLPPKISFLFLFFLSTLIINAMVCGTLSGVFPRYQARVMWLYTLPLMLYFVNQKLSIKKCLLPKYQKKIL